jgi:hypothetical protein
MVRRAAPNFNGKTDILLPSSRGALPRRTYLTETVTRNAPSDDGGGAANWALSGQKDPDQRF